ncbi:MAG: nickel pincer cofactor biosynthesis protein LarC [Phormidesmis sp.]
MKTLAYLDCPTGIAGDMCIGALVHAGVPLTYLIDSLAKLGIQAEFELRSESVLRNQQAATKVFVDLLSPSPEPFNPSVKERDLDQHDHNHDHSHDHSHDPTHARGHAGNHPHRHHHARSSRRLPEIESLINHADLPSRATQWSLRVFRQLAEAEAAVHGIPPEQVHFHEVGATDAIVDIVGTCLGLDWLGVDGVVCSPLPTGGGTVRCEHGLLPVPAPAVLNMMMRSQVPVYSNGINQELVTPTGCAIATALASAFGPPPNFVLQKIGLGAGGKDFALPNILRLWIGTVDDFIEDDLVEDHPIKDDLIKGDSTVTPSIRPQTKPSSPDSPTVETITELQTQIDDCSPQAIGYLFEQLFAAGAVDVFSQAVTMKKHRLGTLVSVLCPSIAVETCEALLFQETTTLGVRRSQQTRTVLAREMVMVSTAYGEISVKVARSQDQVINLQPEYEDCAQIARSHRIPWRQVHQAAMSAAVSWAQADPKKRYSNG